MSNTDESWEARVAAWKASGLTASAFCKGKDYTAAGLRYWAGRLPPPPVGALRLARVVTSATLTAAKAEGAQAAAPAAEVESPAPADDAAVFIELAGVRVGVRRGFDAAVLRGVLDVLGGGR